MAAAEFEQLQLKPLGLDGDQWPEARGFSRLYGRDPHTQARLARTLIGFRSLAEGMHESETVEAIDVVIRAFADHFPDFLTPSKAEEQNSDIFREDYTPETRLLWLIDPIIADQEP